MTEIWDQCRGVYVSIFQYQIGLIELVRFYTSDTSVKYTFEKLFQFNRVN